MIDWLIDIQDRIKELFFTCSHSITVQITAPLLGVSLYLLFIYLLYDRIQGLEGGLVP